MALKPDNRELASAALRLLAGRDMSRAEFVKKLAAKQFVPTEIEQAADWCSAEGWLNEPRYAEIAGRSLGRKFSSSRVAQTLRQKGVGEEATAATLATLKESDFERAQALWSRKFGAPADNPADKARQVRYLQSRGYGFDLIKRVITGEASQR